MQIATNGLMYQWKLKGEENRRGLRWTFGHGAWMLTKLCVVALESAMPRMAAILTLAEAYLDPSVRGGGTPDAALTAAQGLRLEVDTLAAFAALQGLGR